LDFKQLFYLSRWNFRILSVFWFGEGQVYETFGIVKYYPIKLQLLLIGAVPLEYALHRQLTIPRVGRPVFIFSVTFLSICYFVSVCRALGQTHSLIFFYLLAKPQRRKVFYPFLYSTIVSVCRALALVALLQFLVLSVGSWGLQSRVGKGNCTPSLSQNRT
jgi:hypothetical protein